MLLLVLRPGQRQEDGPPERNGPSVAGTDDWRAFGRLTAVVVCRSILVYGVSSFLALYLIEERGATEATAGNLLTLFLVAGTAGTLLGGWLADRVGRVSALRWGYAGSLPALVAVVLADNVALTGMAIALLGVTAYVPPACTPRSGRSIYRTGSAPPPG